MTAPHPTRTRGSQALHLLGRFAESTLASTVAAAVSAAFLVAALWAPRATPWLTAFQSLAAAITLVMVFALQHTQSRHQAALQRKLDEILRVLPAADPRLLRVEEATDDELTQLGEEHGKIRARALSDEAPSD